MRLERILLNVIAYCQFEYNIVTAPQQPVTAAFVSHTRMPVRTIS